MQSLKNVFRINTHFHLLQSFIIPGEFESSKAQCIVCCNTPILITLNTYRAQRTGKMTEISVGKGCKDAIQMYYVSAQRYRQSKYYIRCITTVNKFFNRSQFHTQPSPFAKLIAISNLFNMYIVSVIGTHNVE